MELAGGLEGAHTMRVYCARDAVGNFDVQLRDDVLYSQRRLGSVSIVALQSNSLRTGVHARIADIPDSSTLDHVTDGEALDRLVLAHASRAVRAAHELDVAAALLVAAVVSSLLGLRRETVSNCSHRHFPYLSSVIQSPSMPSIVFFRHFRAFRSIRISKRLLWTI